MRILKDFDLTKDTLLYTDSMGYSKGDLVANRKGDVLVLGKNLSQYSSANEICYLTMVQGSTPNFRVKAGEILSKIQKSKPLVYNDKCYIPLSEKHSKVNTEPELTYSEEELVPSQFFGLDDYLKLN